jgi:hypothetical protein
MTPPFPAIQDHAPMAEDERNFAGHAENMKPPLNELVRTDETWWPYGAKEDPKQRPGKGMRIVIDAVCAWSLIEAPLELDPDSGLTGLLGLAVAKAVVLSVGLAAHANVRFSRLAFALICGASVLAIAPSLPFTFEHSPVISLFSAVECAMKTALVIAFSIESGRTARSGP